MKKFEEQAKKKFQIHKNTVLTRVAGFLVSRGNVGQTSIQELNELQFIIEKYHARMDLLITQYFVHHHKVGIPDDVSTEIRVFKSNVKALEILLRRMRDFFLTVKKKYYLKLLEIEFILFDFRDKSNISVDEYSHQGCYLYLEEQESPVIMICFFYSPQHFEKRKLVDVIDNSDEFLPILDVKNSEGYTLSQLEPSLPGELTEFWYSFYCRRLKYELVVLQDNEILKLAKINKAMCKIFPSLANQFNDFFRNSNCFITDWISGQLKEHMNSEYFCSVKKHYEDEINKEINLFKEEVSGLIYSCINQLRTMLNWNNWSECLEVKKWSDFPDMESWGKSSVNRSWNEYLDTQSIRYEKCKADKQKLINYLLRFAIRSQRKKESEYFNMLQLTFDNIFTFFTRVESFFSTYKKKLVADYPTPEEFDNQKIRINKIFSVKEHLIQEVLASLEDEGILLERLNNFNWYNSFIEMIRFLSDKAINTVALGFDATGALMVDPRAGPLCWENDQVFLDEIPILTNLLLKNMGFELFYYIEIKIEEILGELDYFYYKIFYFLFHMNYVIKECKPEKIKSDDFFENWQKSILDNQEFIEGAEEIDREYQRLCRKYHANGLYFITMIARWKKFPFADHLVKLLELVQANIESRYDTYIRGMRKISTLSEFEGMSFEGKDPNSLAGFIDLYRADLLKDYKFYFLYKNNIDIDTSCFEMNSIYLTLASNIIKVFVHHSSLVGTEVFSLEYDFSQKILLVLPEKDPNIEEKPLEINLPVAMQENFYSQCRWVQSNYSALVEKLRESEVKLRDKYMSSQEQVYSGAAFLTRQVTALRNDFFECPKIIPHNVFFGSPTFQQAARRFMAVKNQSAKSREESFSSMTLFFKEIRQQHEKDSKIDVLDSGGEGSSERQGFYFHNNISKN